MSIVALKRNSQRYINPISHNQGANGFALNGTLRNVGWIGQTSLDRIGTVNSFCVAQTPSIVKTSTKNTLGHLSSRVRYPLSAGCTAGGKCDPLNHFMSLHNKALFENDHTASGHIDEVVNKTICINNTGKGCTNQFDVKNNPSAFKSNLSCPPNGSCTAGSYYIGGRRVYNKQYNKDVSSFAAMSSGDYIQRLKKPLKSSNP